jgi:hypothetical protein
MKTPREILLGRHRSAEPALHELRRQVLANLLGNITREIRPMNTPPRERWSAWEFVLSLRWHLAGLTAAWLAVAALSFEPSKPPGTTLARSSASPPRQLLIALREHRRQLLELLAAPVTPPAAVPHASAPVRRHQPTEIALLA